ncbi:MAG: hypothetical protein HC915_05185 [Anaerolineae bacterium]|nr:hypothetical protein [Anaerolineae bacterium]
MAETVGALHAEIIAGLLRSVQIPVYIDLDMPGSLFPSSAFGNLSGIARIFVPQEYYEIALVLLEEDDPDQDYLDEASIQP